MTRFDNMLGNVRKAKEEPKGAKGNDKMLDSKDDGDDVKAQFWQEVAQPERVATIRLNFDIPVELDDKLKAKARENNTTKTALVRKLLEFMLDE